MDVHLWIADPAQLSERACAAILEDDELARARAFRFDRHRREYLSSRALVRRALSRHDGRPPCTWRFVRNAHGKPRALAANGLAFNLANHPTLVVCAIAARDLGVDVEPIDRGREILALAPVVFTAGERTALAALAAAARPDRAVSLWTLKEAYIKARGLGLDALPLASFSINFASPSALLRAGRSADLSINFASPSALLRAGRSADLSIDFHDDRIALAGDDGARWELRTLDLAGHRIALAVAAPLHRIHTEWLA
jgi:4'-phosphopantetheinyl transferase